MSHSVSMSEQLTHSTVRIVTESSEGIGTGTGFFYRFASNGSGGYTGIVTNKHVIENASKVFFCVHVVGEDGNPDYSKHEIIELDNISSRCVFHPDTNIDLCAIFFVDIVQQKLNENKHLFCITLDSSLIPSSEEIANMSAIEDVVMIGYPNGIWDSTNNMPILRRGTTATHPKLDWCGKSEFLIDIACFRGSSGSPVFLYNMGGYFLNSQPLVSQNKIRIKLIGILYSIFQHTVTGEIQTLPIPVSNNQISLSQIPNNLGIIIKSHNLKMLDDLMREHLPPLP